VQEYRQKQAAIEKKQKIRQLASERGIQLKTKIAKGPNPLSVKKKQLKPHAQHQPPHSSDQA
jgi:hypothetical protein